jgi:hypothetical protein
MVKRGIFIVIQSKKKVYRVDHVCLTIRPHVTVQELLDRTYETLYEHYAI